MSTEFYYRNMKCKECCEEVIPVFAFFKYIPKDQKEDLVSKAAFNFYKFGNDLPYFVKKFVEFYNKRIEDDPEYKQFDLVCLCPSHEQGGLNKNMLGLIQEFSKQTGVPYVQVLYRTRMTEPQNKQETVGDRDKNVRDSISISEQAKGKNLIVIDNECTSGATIRDIHRTCKRLLVKNVVFLTVGISARFEGTDFDINPNFTGKISRVIKTFHGTVKFTREQREEWKERTSKGS